MAHPGTQHHAGDLGAVAAELYALRPDEFTAARDRQAADARRAGDAQLSASIKQLRRPSTAAWLANLLVRRSPERVAALLDVGTALRQAQASLTRDAIRQLGEDGRRAVAALMGDARRVAGELGQPVSGAVALELEGTLKAALADPDAAEALTRGQLTVPLRYAGLGPAGPGVGAAVTTGPEGLENDSQAAPAGGGDPRGRPGEAERRLIEALDALAQARVRAHEGDRQATEARRHLEEVRAEASDLEARLRELREAEARAEADLRKAEAARDAAARSAAEAQQRVTEAKTVIARVIPDNQPAREPPGDL